MNINQTNAYSVNPYSTTTNNNTQKVDTETKTDKVSGKHHHHHGRPPGNSTDKSKNIQSNGTDSIQISKEGIDALSSATRTAAPTQTYSPSRISPNSNTTSTNTTTPQPNTTVEE